MSLRNVFSDEFANDWIAEELAREEQLDEEWAKYLLMEIGE